jgi:hypothetical protein
MDKTNTPKTELGQLCEPCRVIKFDDSHPDLHTKPTKNGQVRLVFTPEWQISTRLESYRSDTYPEFPLLESSANEGCGFCRLLRSTILGLLRDRIQSSDKTSREISIKLEYVWTGYNSRTCLEYFIARLLYSQDPQKSARKNETLIYFEILADDPVAQYLGIEHQPARQEFLSSEYMESINSWADECELHHLECQRGNFIPRRLVDVGINDQSLRVVETPTDPRFAASESPPRYVALSYCWGVEDPLQPHLKTEVKSLESRMTQIDPHIVPSALLNAFEVTRALGYQFIWIDAL